MLAPIPREEPREIGETLRRRLAGFVRTLRDNGFRVGLAETRDALSVLASPAANSRPSLQAAFRSLFSATRSDWERFDEIFVAYWIGRQTLQVSLGGAASGEPDAAKLPAPPGEPLALRIVSIAGR